MKIEIFKRARGLFTIHPKREKPDGFTEDGHVWYHFIWLAFHIWIGRRVKS